MHTQVNINKYVQEHTATHMHRYTNNKNIQVYTYTCAYAHKPHWRTEFLEDTHPLLKYEISPEKHSVPNKLFMFPFKHVWTLTNHYLRS